MRTRRALPFLTSLLAGLAGCGSDPAPIEDPDRDDTATLSSCQKFEVADASFDTYPVVYDGTLDAASSSLSVSAGQCEVESAPFGVETPGPDTVVALTNLVPGQEYVLRLFSQADLAMYVATGCDETLQGPPPGECLLFVDNTVAPPERGRFVAPASGEVRVVVDYFLAAAPVVSEFSLDVYAAECSTDAECSTGAGVCVDSRCVECATDFDCQNPAAPLCDGRSNACVAGDDACTNDDASEGANDGPAGATDVTPATGAAPTTVSDTGAICNAPQAELDFFKFEVTEAGASYTVELDWTDDALDLDFGVFDATGRQIGASLWQQPEQIEVTHLATGTYYASVNLFGGTTTAARPYTITVTKTSVAGCVDASDCAAAYDTQLFRGECVTEGAEAGACVSIENAAPDGELAACDSNDDCSSGVCSVFSFTKDADLRAVCTGGCTADSECAGLGADFVCTDYLTANICVPKCSEDDHCAVLIGSRPTCAPTDTACLLNPPTWTHLSCNVDTGKCELP